MAGRGVYVRKPCTKCMKASKSFGSLGARCSVHRQGPVAKDEMISLSSSSMFSVSEADASIIVSPGQATSFMAGAFSVHDISNKNPGKQDTKIMTMSGKPVPPPNATSTRSVMPEIISVSSSSPCVMSDTKNDGRKFHKPGASLD